jgi:alkylated DNA nucleotide flippase Atl1
VSLVADSAEFTQGGAGRQARPARRPAGDSAGNGARPVPGAGEAVIAADERARAWEAAYRHYGRIWELTARSPKGDPVAAREMAAASRAVAAAWRQIETSSTLPWWTVAAIESAAAAFEEQAQKYGTDDSESYSHGQGR